MSDRLSGGSNVDVAVTGPAHASPSVESIPVAHLPLIEARVADFACWMDGELERLEQRFRSFTTRNSLKVSLKR